MKHVPPRNSSPTLKIVLLLLVIALPLACTMLGRPFGGSARTPAHSWNSDRGPVVPHDRFPDDCRICHQGDGWHRIRDDFHFDHGKETGTRLDGAHQTAECLRCHNDRGQVKIFSSRGCKGCHEDFHKGKLGTECKSCHDQKTWVARDVIANHAMTRFPLVGAHAGTACWACHPGAQVGEFKRGSTDCITCHKQTLAQAVTLDHRANGWTRDCQRCHGSTNWRASGFTHAFFPLEGAHNTERCATCHTNGRFRGLNRDCFNCHQEAWLASANPNHQQAGFSKDCRKCHGSQGWKGAHFRHPWPLVGQHLAVACKTCHESGYTMSDKHDCASCHIAAYNATREPNHRNAGFSTSCTICHQASGWKGANFVHRWPLTGAHVGKFCERCHKGGNFKTAKKDCYGCHKAEYDRAAKPNHRLANFSTDCTLCHNTGGWSGAHFRHKWPLKGSHAALSCTTCHKGGAYQRIPKDCIDCHRADYDRTTKPNHKNASFSTQCSECHNETGWQGANFKHTWPLQGAHSAVSCDSCHPNQVYKGTTKECIGCHKADFDKTTNPNHRTLGFSHQCLQCHNMSGWKGARFNHVWPLTGGHSGLTCIRCHQNNVYKNTPKDCYSCHQAQYQATTNPNHQKAAFSTQCQTCHNINTWKGASYTHAWPLTGAHAASSCIKCHQNQVYKGTPKDCYSCHKAQYDSATNPNHRGLGYPTRCSSCHTTSSFKPSTWTHKFPLEKKHAVSCKTCHTVPTNFKTFTCLVCHEHNKTKMDDKHKGKTGYVYSSPACYNCHPRGKG